MTDNLKQINRRADRIFNTRNPVIKEYLANGPIRTKKAFIAYLRADRRVDSSTGYKSYANDVTKLIHRFEKVPDKYIFVLGGYRSITNKDLDRVKVSIKHVQKIRDNGLRKAVKADLSATDIRMLRRMLNPKHVTTRQKPRLNSIINRLGINKSKRN